MFAMYNALRFRLLCRAILWTFLRVKPWRPSNLYRVEVETTVPVISSNSRCYFLEMQRGVFKHQPDYVQFVVVIRLSQRIMLAGVFGVNFSSRLKKFENLASCVLEILTQILSYLLKCQVFRDPLPYYPPLQVIGIWRSMHRFCWHGLMYVGEFWYLTPM